MSSASQREWSEGTKALPSLSPIDTEVSVKGEVRIVRSNSSVAPKAAWAKKEAPRSPRRWGPSGAQAWSLSDLARGQTTAIDVEAARLFGLVHVLCADYEGAQATEKRRRRRSRHPGVNRSHLFHTGCSINTPTGRRRRPSEALCRRPPEQPSDEGAEELARRA